VLVMREKKRLTIPDLGPVSRPSGYPLWGVGVLKVSRKRKLDLDNVERTEADAS